MKKLVKNNVKEVIAMDNKNVTTEHKALEELKNKLKMDAKIVKEGVDTFLKVHLFDNYYAEVLDDTTFEEGRPLNVSLTYGDIGICNVSTNTIEDCVLLVNDIKKVAEGLTLLGFDDTYDVEHLSDEVTKMIQRRVKIHNLLVDYNFKIGENDSKDELTRMNINPDDYVIKGKSFMNKNTKKLVTIY